MISSVSVKEWGDQAYGMIGSGDNGEAEGKGRQHGVKEHLAIVRYISEIESNDRELKEGRKEQK